MKIVCSNNAINECRAVFGILPMKLQMQIRKVRFLQNVIDSDNTVCSSFVRDATSELLCLCNAYSANERNIIKSLVLLSRLTTLYTIFRVNSII